MRSFVVTVEHQDAELATDRLWQIGVQAVEERATADGRVELWTAVGEDDASVAAAERVLEPHWGRHTVNVTEEWDQSWREYATTMMVGERLVVVPAWRDVPADVDGRVVIVIEPAAAFGLGDHPTTALTLAALDRELRERSAATVLDVGCGTGILSIAAIKLGAHTVRAVDVSTAAIEATSSNADRNGVDDRVVADTTPIRDVAGRFDVVVANILAPSLIAMSSDLARLTAPAGRLVVSGILDGAHAHVLDALDMAVIRTDADEGWAAVTLTHR